MGLGLFAVQKRGIRRFSESVSSPPLSSQRKLEITFEKRKCTDVTFIM